MVSLSVMHYKKAASKASVSRFKAQCVAQVKENKERPYNIQCAMHNQKVNITYKTTERGLNKWFEENCATHCQRPVNKLSVLFSYNKPNKKRTALQKKFAKATMNTQKVQQ